MYNLWQNDKAFSFNNLNELPKPEIVCLILSTIKMNNQEKDMLESFGKRPFRLGVRVREFSGKNFEGWGWVLPFLPSWTPAYRVLGLDQGRRNDNTHPQPSNFLLDNSLTLTLRRKSCFPKLSNGPSVSWKAICQLVAADVHDLDPTDIRKHVCVSWLQECFRSRILRGPHSSISDFPTQGRNLPLERLARGVQRLR